MKSKEEKIAVSIFLTTVALCSVILFLYFSLENQIEPTETTCEVTTQATTEETALPITEHTEEETVVTEPPATSETIATVTLYDIPLDEDLQLFIIDRAEMNGIEPEIIFAMAYRESSYDASAIGDSGDSLGLLQIQPKWNEYRMQQLGCDNLLDPYQNVVVGVDILAWQLDRYGDMAKALTAYNRGHYEGTITDYAKDVLEKAEELTTYTKEVNT